MESDTQERLVEIYEIRCSVTTKRYIGQTVSYVLNHGKLRRYGMARRLISHFSEAKSSKKNQCSYLNNAIRKYGTDKFSVHLIEICNQDISDVREAHFINERNTLAPNGYNLLTMSCTTLPSTELRSRIALSLRKTYFVKKLERFLNVPVDYSKADSYIKPLRRNGQHFGYYVWISGKKAEFCGVSIPLEKSYEDALTFIRVLEERWRDTLLREHPKAPATTPAGKLAGGTTVNARWRQSRLGVIPPVTALEMTGSLVRYVQKLALINSAPVGPEMGNPQATP